MLTITYNSKKLYINIALLKKRFKKAIITVLKVLTTLSIIAGILLIIGTTGAFNLHKISTTQIIIQALKGFLLCGIAWVLNFIKLVIE